jgi:hypothetical protein
MECPGSFAPANRTTEVPLGITRLLLTEHDQLAIKATSHLAEPLQVMLDLRMGRSAELRKNFVEQPH